MPKELTFASIPVRSLFVTGPADTLFIKLDDEDASFSGTLPNGAGVGGSVPGGHAIAIEDGRKVWTPANRIVIEPSAKHFTEAGRIYLWKHMS